MDSSGSRAPDASIEVELEEEPWEYVLVRLTDGRHFLRIMANQSAFYYFKDHELAPEELREYEAHGKKALMRLAKAFRYR